MPGPLLHVGALATCPHMGAIQTPPSNTRVLVNNMLALTIADVPSIVGCPFQIPVGAATKPQPCVTVKMVPSTKVLVNNQPAVILMPTTMCVSIEQIPQGPPTPGALQTRAIAL